MSLKKMLTPSLPSNPVIQYSLFTGKLAEMSSQNDPDYPASKCLDTIHVPADKYSSICHTLKETNPWWRVDLETEHCISGVNVLSMPGKLPQLLSFFINFRAHFRALPRLTSLTHAHSYARMFTRK